ncbi:MAG: polysaccharide deacetylase family protein [Clostridia bacterium]|nr:polysaccharide deacetylase family protein [Clostridia bacterium]
MKTRRIVMRFPEGRAKTLTFSYDDGVIQDIRFVGILNQYGMKGTFNLNSGLYAPEDQNPEKPSRRMTERQINELFIDSPHEIAVHSYSHPSLATLPAAAVAYETVKDRELLERQFGRIVRGMAYPNGSVCDDVVTTLRQCGIVYARTVVSTEKFKLPEDWLRLPATCHHNNPRLMELAKKFAETEIQSAREPQMFYLWGHTYEFDDNDNWEVIEEFCDYMSGREREIWYATNMEIYEYIEDYNRLVWTVDMSRVYNPTCRTLWFTYEKKTVAIRPDETLNLEEPEAE